MLSCELLIYEKCRSELLLLLLVQSTTKDLGKGFHADSTPDRPAALCLGRKLASIGHAHLLQVVVSLLRTCRISTIERARICVRVRRNVAVKDIVLFICLFGCFSLSQLATLLLITAELALLIRSFRRPSEISEKTRDPDLGFCA